MIYTEIIYWAIIGLITGPILRATYNFAWKKFKAESTAFDLKYFFAMLISMIMTVGISPVFLIPGAIRSVDPSFIFIATAAMGYTASSIINKPISYLIKGANLQPTTVKTLSLGTTTRRSLIIVAVIALIAVLGVTTVYAIQTYNITVGSHGKIKGIGVAIYSNAAGTIPCTVVDWGTVEPGAIVPFTVYVKSTGNSPITLSYTTTNFNPASSQQYLTLTWNYTGAIVPAYALIPVQMTLSVSPAITGVNDFSFDITISGSG